MSAATTGPEIQGTLSEAPPDKKRKKKDDGPITGKSPMQIAWGRLRRDKIAMLCLTIVFFFVLIAIFAGVIANAFNVTTETQFATEFIDVLNGNLPKIGPPLHPFTMDHPFGVAPASGMVSHSVP